MGTLLKLVGSSVPVDESHSLLEPLLRDKSKVAIHTDEELLQFSQCIPNQFICIRSPPFSATKDL